MDKLKNAKGVTLIALVITIIVLLILAGVSIAMLTGENGILTKAQSAKEKSESAEAEELVRLAVLASYETNGQIDFEDLKENLLNVENIEEFGDIDSLPKDVIVNGQVLTITEEGDVEEGIAEDGKELTEKNRTLAGKTAGYSYKNPVIPQGFYPLNTKTSKWKYVNNDKIEVEGWNEGLVITDAEGNEFVWVPVDGKIVKYAKWDASTDISEEDCSDDTDVYPVTDESVQIENGGFYVARYEAGYEKASSNSTNPNDNAEIKPVSKKGMKILNNITYGNAAASAKLMINDEAKYGNNKSGLITGTQWDTIMDWYNESQIGVIRIDTINTAGKTVAAQNWGTYKDFTYRGTGSYFTFDGSVSNEWENGNFTHSASIEDISPSNKACYHASGLNSIGIKKNIADLGGNVWEWTAEEYSLAYSPTRVSRGGAADNAGSAGPRNYSGLTYTAFNLGFRAVLYIQ